MPEKTLGQIAFEAANSFFPDQGEWAGWPPKWEDTSCKHTWEAAASAVVERCIAKLSGEIKSVTLGHELEGRVSQEDALALLNQQLKIDVQILRSLIKEKNDDAS